MALNQSRVKLYRRCQKAYAFRYDYSEKYGNGKDRELIPKVTKVALFRGSWMHALQEVHHKLWAGLDHAIIKVPEGRTMVNAAVDSWEMAHERMTAYYNSLFEEERHELGNLPDECDRLFNAYLSFYAGDNERYRPILLGDGVPASEFIIEVPLTKWGIKEPFKGTVDLLVEDLEYGGIWIWDAKWVKKVPAAEERMMSPQALMYAWALRKMGHDIRGFVFNYGRTKAPVIPAVLKRGTLSMRKNMDTNYETYLAEIKEIHKDRWKEYRDTIYSEFLETLKGKEVLWFRRERIPVETSRIKQALGEFVVTGRQIDKRNKGQYVPRSYFYNCKFGCEYHDLCVTEFNGLDITPLIHANFQFTGERYGEDGDLLAS